MRLHPIFAALTLVAAVAHPARAADPVPKIDCATAVTTPEIGWCAEQSFIAADRDLNALYARVLAQIAAADGMDAAKRRAWAADLRHAQRHWIAYRDKDCRGVTGWEWHGGTGLGAAINTCLATTSHARAKDLRARYQLLDTAR